MAQLVCKRNGVGCSLRSQTDFSLPQVKSVNYGLKALRYFGAKYRIFFRVILRTLENFENSQKKLKSWIHRNCPCRICENYIYRIGYTNIHDS